METSNVLTFESEIKFDFIILINNIFADKIIKLIIKLKKYKSPFLQGDLLYFLKNKN